MILFGGYHLTGTVWAQPTDPAQGSKTNPAAVGDLSNYEHFLGKYAYEVTPFWVEFEIVRAGNGFAARQPDGAKFADFAAADGALIGKKRGEDMSVQFDRATGKYRLAGTIEVSAFTGNQKARFKSAVTKMKPPPAKALEAQYGVTAASLVNRVRQSEQWVHEFSTLRFTAEVAWSRPPAGIDYRKQQIKAQYPDADLTREQLRHSGLDCGRARRQGGGSFAEAKRSFPVGRQDSVEPGPVTAGVPRRGISCNNLPSRLKKAGGESEGYGKRTPLEQPSKGKLGACICSTVALGNCGGETPPPLYSRKGARKTPAPIPEVPARSG
jgi:hypothetical protein